MRSSTRLLVLTALLAGVVVGCGGTSSVRPTQQLSAADIAAKYQLGSGDQLRVTVFNQQNLSGDFTVDGGGAIALPLLGTVEARAKTLRELEQSIAEGLAGGGYLVNPRVAVQVTQFRPYYILGEVGQPGAYPYTAGLTVRNAVATAKGFTYRANTRRVYIQRDGQRDEQPFDLTPAIAVMPGDTIRIPERLF